MRGHQQFYRHRSPLGAQLLGLILAGFPRVVRAEWRFVVAATQRPHASRAVPRPTSHAPCARLSTRQYATAFNQPLSFDTSKVTTMYYMFQVRSACALADRKSVV